MQRTSLDSIDLSNETVARLRDDEGLPLREYGSQISNKSDPLLSSDHDPTTKNHEAFWSRWKRWKVDWKSGLYAGFCTSVIVLVINIILLLVACFSQGGVAGGIGTIAQGRPEKIQRLSTAYHVLINILSTILLISSNYAMQILCAPTREELNKAHEQDTWLDIGLVSLRNLRFIRKRRVVLFWTLACSSVPLHVL